MRTSRRRTPTPKRERSTPKRSRKRSTKRCSGASRRPIWRCRIVKDGYWYYTRTEQGKSYPIFCRRKGSLDAAEEVILDQNELARGKKFHALGGFDVSPDGSQVLYLEDLTAFREYTLYVKDLTTGRIIDSIDKVWNGTAWADDNRTFFYMTADSAKRGNTVWRHVLGSTARRRTSRCSRKTTSSTTSTSSARAADKYIFICRRRLHLVGMACRPDGEPTAAPRVIAPRRATSNIQRGARRRILLHRDQRRRAQLPDRARARRTIASPGNWTDWLPHRDTAFVEGSTSSRNSRSSASGARGCAACA